jgi:hypothetical protein
VVSFQLAGKRKNKRLLRPQYPITLLPSAFLSDLCGLAVNLPAAGARAMSKKRAAAFATALEFYED